MNTRLFFSILLTLCFLNNYSQWNNNYHFSKGHNNSDTIIEKFLNHIKKDSVFIKPFGFYKEPAIKYLVKKSMNGPNNHYHKHTSNCFHPNSFFNNAIQNNQFERDFKNKIETKKYHVYAIDKNTVIVINSKLGNIQIDNWDKDSIAIEAIITADKDKLNDNYINEFKNFDIETFKANNKVNINTLYTKNSNNFYPFVEIDVLYGSKSKKRRRRSNKQPKISGNIYTDYKIRVPNYIKTRIYHHFGNLVINEIHSESEIHLSHGNFSINKFNPINIYDKTTMHLQFVSNASIGQVTDIDLLVNNSKLKINSVDNIEVSSSYSDIKIEYANTIKIVSTKSDNYSTESLSKLSIINGYFSDFNIEKLRTSLTAYLEQCFININEISNNVSEIDIDSHYGNINLNINKYIHYVLKFKGNKGCRINLPENFVINTFDEFNDIREIIGTNKPNFNIPSCKILLNIHTGKVNLN